MTISWVPPFHRGTFHVSVPTPPAFVKSHALPAVAYNEWRCPGSVTRHAPRAGRRAVVMCIRSGRGGDGPVLAVAGLASDPPITPSMPQDQRRKRNGPPE